MALRLDVASITQFVIAMRRKKVVSSGSATTGCRRLLNADYLRLFQNAREAVHPVERFRVSGAHIRIKPPSEVGRDCGPYEDVIPLPPSHFIDIHTPAKDLSSLPKYSFSILLK